MDPLAQLSAYPLVDALRDRRSRRFGAGMAIPDGPLAYRSRREPQPLSADERALLVWAATGLTGWHLGMPHTASGDRGAGANYPLRFAGRTSPSAAGAQASELIIADDDGVGITQIRDAGPAELRAVREATSLRELVAVTRALTVQVTDARLTIPALAPHVSAHNRWDALQPGTTLLVPVTDMTEYFLTFLSIVTGEGVVLWDPGADAPVGDPAELLAAGRLAESARVPLPAFEQLVFQQASVESGIIGGNAQLMQQAMGLGGWLFGGIDAGSLLGARAVDGVTGLGFDTVPRGPGAPPNPVGLPGYFETLHPHYRGEPGAIIAAFNELKFGARGAFGAGLDPADGPFRDNSGVRARTQRFDDATLRYFTSVLTSLIARTGGFPETVPTVLTSVYLQAQHLDPDFYAAHYRDALPEVQRKHQEHWHAA